MYRHGLSSSIQSVLRDGDVLLSDPDRKHMKTRWTKSTLDELSKPVMTHEKATWVEPIFNFPWFFVAVRIAVRLFGRFSYHFLQEENQAKFMEIQQMFVVSDGSCFLHQRYTTLDFSNSIFGLQLRRPIATNITSPMSDRNLDFEMAKTPPNRLWMVRWFDKGDKPPMIFHKS